MSRDRVEPRDPPGPPAEKTARHSLAEAAETLGSVTDTPRLDAELLMAHALECTRDELLLGRLDAAAPAAFAALVARRLAHEPIAYIIGRRAFWTIELEVGPGVLVPRPDSEALIEAAVELFGESGPVTILDLGTGPGTLLLAALDQWPNATGLGVDRSTVALDYASRNAARLGLGERARFVLGDWGEALAERFDLVLCNPPYVEAGAELAADVADWEPAEALFAGEEGLDAYRLIAPQIGRLIAPGGAACLEIGAGQRNRVTALFVDAGFTVFSRDDLGGVARALIVKP